jgi:hypothetical protein
MNKNIFKQNKTVLSMEKKRMNKRGDTNWVLISLILGVIVLVFLVLGFSLGWNKFLPWLSTSNVDTIKSSCGIACATNLEYGFCTQPRTLNDGTNELKDVTCYQLSNSLVENFDNEAAYGIEACPAITCP